MLDGHHAMLAATGSNASRVAIGNGHTMLAPFPPAACGIRRTTPPRAHTR